jgi:AraC-like DNA-binding protein
MLIIIGIFIAFFLALIILTKKGNNLPDVILGIWMIVIGLHLSSYYAYISGIIYQYPFFLGLHFPFPFLHSPLLYLYTLALTNPSKVNAKVLIIHFIIPFVMILWFLPFFLLSGAEKATVFKNEGRGFEQIMLISEIIMDASGVVYVIANFILLHKHKKRILNQFSNQENINLNWLRFLYFVMTLMWIFIIVIKNDTLIFSATSVFVVFIGYFGIKQVGIFTDKNPEFVENEALEMEEMTLIDETIERKKYAKSGLNQDTAKELHQRLQLLMEREKLFTEAELTLTDLAKRLDIHPNYLSQIINEIEGVNFYDYINGWRIVEFKKLVSLPQNQKFTLLALAYDCGFNSKSAFNRCFKKVTDLSPSEYAKKMVKN